MLDEPTSGIDYQSKQLILNLLRNYGKSYLLTSHDLTEVEYL